MKLPALLAGAGLALAGTAGLLTATAFGIGQQEPTRTVTINVGTGSQGPPGPRGPIGPPGPPGGSACPNGYESGDLRINHPGGQVTIRTCLKEP
jgi:hypothetical protein